MELEVYSEDFTVCKPVTVSDVDLTKGFYFLCRTADELSLVCPTDDVPDDVSDREDGWGCFRISGQLDFSLIGIIYRISGILADKGIGIFVVSTFDTDYVLVKKENLESAIDALKDGGYSIVRTKMKK